MKQASLINYIILIICTTLFSSCELIGGIFKAGMGVGIFLVLAVFIGIGVLVYKFFS